jgi:isopentenyl-diphosphate delta-isomerase
MTHTAKKYPPVVVVDENNNEIGSAMLTEVWQKGLYHRGVSMFIVDTDERMLLQLRSSHVGVYPNCWDQAAAGHVDEGFSYDESAKNELAEELGLDNISLETLGTVLSHNVLDDGRIINQFERVYIGHVPRDVALTLEPEEVAEVRWFTSAELTAEIAEHHEKFTPGLLTALKKYFPAYHA